MISIYRATLVIYIFLYIKCDSKHKRTFDRRFTNVKVQITLQVIFNFFFFFFYKYCLDFLQKYILTLWWWRIKAVALDK